MPPSSHLDPRSAALHGHEANMSQSHQSCAAADGGVSLGDVFKVAEVMLMQRSLGEISHDDGANVETT
jgi:hypothetical protein